MTGARPTREQLIHLAKTDPEAIADLVLMLWDRVEKLEAKVAALELNSRTSGKPPSSDKGNFTNPPKPKSLRGKTGKKPGGQQGHCGRTLSPSDSPDEIIEHRLPAGVRCPKCGAQAADSEHQHGRGLEIEDCECRQVFELPAIQVIITEHRAERRDCPECGTTMTATFPSTVRAPVQYGERIQATALYLGGYQLIPYARLAETFGELFGCPLSQGTLANFVKKGGRQAVKAMEPIRKALIKADVAHADETGCTLHGKRHWLHVFSTRKLTCYHLDAKRGYEAMKRMGLLPFFRGKLIHDCLAAYFRFRDCAHFLCCAHLLRELVYVHEEMEQTWAEDMIALLLRAKELREAEDARVKGSRHAINGETYDEVWSRFSEILVAGFELNPEPPPDPGKRKKRGRVKRSKALNLLIRLEDRVEEIMGFFEYERVPFDNNQAERDLRMMKVREKISGTFRSEQHGDAYCSIRSILSSARKQSRAMLDCLSDLIKTPELLGATLASAQ